MKYKAYEDYVFNGRIYWYGSCIHIKPAIESIDFGLGIYVHSQFHILMEGV